MIRIQTISALFIKQLQDTLKNMPILVLFLIYPCIALVMTQAMKDQAGTQDIFLSIFATMHCVFTPIVSISGMMSEEKEKNTLRVLIMSNVTLREYFISIGGFVLIADLISGSSFIAIAGLSVTEAFFFLVSLGIGCPVSILLGICIGLYAKNAAAANGLAVPCAMIFAFLPMLSFFNETIKSAARFTYGQQISSLLSGNSLTLFGLIVIIFNLLIFIFLASVLYRRSLSVE